MTRPGCVNFSGYSCVTKGLANEDIAQLKRGRDGVGVGVWALGSGLNEVELAHEMNWRRLFWA